ncbi:ABC transporter permease [Arhodomonas sp. AD133]|uniref:ABC transporter permease n=1 Tax=Arhodomonas sp. AD133 TaxID=3415009 RepID=UPI003EB79351
MNLSIDSAHAALAPAHRQGRHDWRKRASNTAYRALWSLPPLVWQTLFFVLPLVFLLVLTFWVVHNYRLQPDFSISNWFKVYGTPHFWDTYGRTLGLALSSSVVTTLVAFPCAYALAFRASPAVRRLGVLLLVTPFFTSYLVRIYSWMAILSDQGVLNAALESIGISPVTVLNTGAGTLVGYLTLCLPLAVLIQLMSLGNVDRTLVEAAHNLRCPPWRTVFSVVIPAARVGIIVAAVFTFILSFGDFVSPTYLGGGNPPTLSILITDLTKSGQQWPRAAVVAITMIVTLLTMVSLALGFAYRRRGIK